LTLHGVEANLAGMPDQPETAGPFSQKVPEGDNHLRAVCDTCGFINYVNPKIVVGAVVSYEDSILLCKRAIDPRIGYWTIPAGYMEERESTEQGAMREAEEEACAKIQIDSMLALYNIPRISQVQVIYRAQLLEPKFAAGTESLEVRLFHWNEIPWDNLAFPSVHWALHHFDTVRDQTYYPAFGAPPDWSMRPPIRKLPPGL